MSPISEPIWLGFAAVLSCFTVKKQRSDTVHLEDAKPALESGQSSAFASADSNWATVSPASPVPAGDHTGLESSTGSLGQSLSKEASLQPGAFLQEGAAESIRRRLHQASPSSAAGGSSFILVLITLSLFVMFWYIFFKFYLIVNNAFLNESYRLMCSTDRRIFIYKTAHSIHFYSDKMFCFKKSQFSITFVANGSRLNWLLEFGFFGSGLELQQHAAGDYSILCSSHFILWLCN